MPAQLDLDAQQTIQTAQVQTSLGSVQGRAEQPFRFQQLPCFQARFRPENQDFGRAGRFAAGLGRSL